MRASASVVHAPSRSDELAHDPTIRERFEVAQNHLLLARQAAGRGLEPLAMQELVRARVEVEVVLRSLQRAQRSWGPRSTKIHRLARMVGALGSELRSTSAAFSVR